MPRAVKWILVAAASLVGVLVIAIVIAYALFDSAAAKRKVIDEVAQRTGRTLVIEGDLGLSVFPTLGVTLGKTTLSEPRSQTVAASIERAKLSVALWPLMRKQVQVDRVVLDGVTTTLVRGRDGKTNFDDLLGKGSAPANEPESPKSSAPPAFDIAGVEITRSAFKYRDVVAGTDVALSNVNIKTGRLANGVKTPLDVSLHIEGKQPAVNGDLRAKGNLQFELAAQRYAFESFDATWKGRVAERGLDAEVSADALRLALAEPTYAAKDVKLVVKSAQGVETMAIDARVPDLNITPSTANAKQIRANITLTGTRTVDADVRIDQASGNAKALTAQVALDAKGSEKRANGERRFTVALKTPLAADLTTLAFDLAKLAGNVEIEDPALPMKKLALPINGQLKAEVKAERIAGAFDTRFENSPATFKFNVAGFTKPRIGFDLNAQSLDIDKLAPPTPQSTTAAPAKSTPPSEAAKADTPVDLSALKTIDVDGKVRIGNLVARGIKASNLNLGLAVRQGEARIAPFSLALYGGTAEGTMSANANNNRIA
ncbi:MAG TPA: AsmA family protein, partial [Burkholderiaceae bacterium]|nr:AsmA family protein [Burkholderiaceae bacterium]